MSSHCLKLLKLSNQLDQRKGLKTKLSAITALGAEGDESLRTLEFAVGQSEHAQDIRALPASPVHHLLLRPHHHFPLHCGDDRQDAHQRHSQGMLYLNLKGTVIYCDFDATLLA